MHYYPFNIADYRKDTSHLTPIEHYIYRQLIDWYYLDEKPIPKKTQSVMRRLGLVSENEPLLLNVLNDFFEECESGWFHGRISEEIEQYHKKRAVNAENGKKGGRPKKQQLTEIEKPKKTQPVKFANRNESELKPNQEPLTKNQEPLDKTSAPSASGSKGSRLQNDWKPTDDFLKAAREINSTLGDQQIKLIADTFRDYWISKPGSAGVKLNWLATWRNWIRRDTSTPQQKPAPRKLMPKPGDNR